MIPPAAFDCVFVGFTRAAGGRFGQLQERRIPDLLGLPRMVDELDRASS